MRTAIGIDSSTQSCKVIAVDARTGETVAAGSAPHPDGTAVDPQRWVEALRRAWGAAGVDRGGDLVGVGVAAQQHGMVALGAEGRPVHDALLWNDLRSAGQAERMVADLGTPGWMQAVNVLPVPAITLTKLAWLRAERPEEASRVRQVLLPHDWLTLQLSGAFVTDRSDASGTGYYDPVGNAYRRDLVERYFGAVPDLPEVLAADQPAGKLRAEWGQPVAVSAGLGDNAGAALGLELEPGDVVLSVGTSGTVFTRSSQPLRDPSGITAGFADGTGEHLPLLCTLNAARVLTSTAGLLGANLDEFDQLALAQGGDAGGLTMLPYFDGERTPNLPKASGRLHGLTRVSLTRENMARAAVLSIANSLADCLDVLRGIGAPVNRVLLIGGGAKSRALRALLPDTLRLPVEVPEVREYVALGAARQAVWAATGELPRWGRRTETTIEPAGDQGVCDYRAQYAVMRSELVNSSG